MGIQISHRVSIFLWGAEAGHGLEAYGSSQAGNRIGAVAACIHHSHSNTRSKLHTEAHGNTDLNSLRKARDQTCVLTHGCWPGLLTAEPWKLQESLDWWLNTPCQNLSREIVIHQLSWVTSSSMDDFPAALKRKKKKNLDPVLKLLP